MKQKNRSEDAAGVLLEEIKELESFEHMQPYEEEIRSLTENCGGIYSLFCC